MTKLTITLNVKDGVDLDTLKTDISKALIVIDGVEGITVAEGSVGKIIPVFTGGRSRHGRGKRRAPQRRTLQNDLHKQYRFADRR